MTRLQLLASSGDFGAILQDIHVEGTFIQLNRFGEGVRQVSLGITEDNFLIAEQTIADYKKSPGIMYNNYVSLELEGFELVRLYPLRFLFVSVIDDEAMRLAVCTCMGHVTYFELCNTDQSFESIWSVWKREVDNFFGSAENFELLWEQHLNTFKMNSPRCRESQNLYFFPPPDTSLLLRSVKSQTDGSYRSKDRYVDCVHKIKNIHVANADNTADKSTTTTFSCDSASDSFRFRPNITTKKSEYSGQELQGHHSSSHQHSDGLGKRLKRKLSLRNKVEPFLPSDVTHEVLKKKAQFFSHSIEEFETWRKASLPVRSSSCMHRISYKTGVFPSTSTVDLQQQNSTNNMTSEEVGLLVSVWKEESTDDQLKELKHKSFPLKLQQSVQKICKERSSESSLSGKRISASRLKSDSEESITDIVEEHKIQEKTNLWKTLKSSLPKKPKSNLEELIETVVFQKCVLKPKSIADFNVKDVSRQLSLINKCLILQIPLQESVIFFTQPFHENKLPNIMKLIETTYHIGLHVIREVTSQSEPSRQAEILKLWIEVALICKNNNDFQSAYSVITGLQNISIYRLNKAWAIVSTEWPDIMKSSVELDEYFSKSKNYKFYSSNQSMKKRYTKRIPWVHHFFLHKKLQRSSIIKCTNQNITSRHSIHRVDIETTSSMNENKTSSVTDINPHLLNKKVEHFCDELAKNIYESSKDLMKPCKNPSDSLITESLQKAFPHSVLVHQEENNHFENEDVTLGNESTPLDMSNHEGDFEELKCLFPKSSLLHQSSVHEKEGMHSSSEENRDANSKPESENNDKFPYKTIANKTCDAPITDVTKSVHFDSKYTVSEVKHVRQGEDIDSNKVPRNDEELSGKSSNHLPVLTKLLAPRRSIYEAGHRRKSCFEQAIEESSEMEQDNGDFEKSVKSQMQLFRRGSKYSAIFNETSDTDENNSFGHENSENRKSCMHSKTGKKKSGLTKIKNKECELPKITKCFLCGNSKCIYNFNFSVAFIQIQIEVSKISYPSNLEIEKYLLHSRHIHSEYECLLSSLQQN